MNEQSVLDALPRIPDVDLAAALRPSPEASLNLEALEDEAFTLGGRAAPVRSLIEGAVDDRKWSAIQYDALVALDRGKHLKILVVLSQSLLHTHGYWGLAAGFALMRILLEQQWDELQPGLVDGDAYRRLNELATLGAPEFLGELRNGAVFGKLRLRELLDPKTKDADIRAQYMSATPEARRGAARASQELKQIARVMADHGAPCSELGEAAQVLDTAANACRALAQKYGETTEMAETANNFTMKPAPSLVPESVHLGPTVGQIRGPDDVISALDAICEYYRTHERSSPVPLLLERAKRLVNRSFLEAIQDIADKGLPQVEILLGVPPSKK